MLAFPVASLAEEAAKAPVKAEETPAAAASAPCQGLKPFKEIDELMHQIYSNLESDCLFKMDPKELAQIWGIPTVIYTNVHKSPASSGEEKPPSKSEHGHIALLVYEIDEDPDVDYFMIWWDYDKQAIEPPFFRYDNYPKLLPEPLICGYTYQYLCWPNSDKTRMMLLSGGDGRIKQVFIRDHDRPQPMDDCRYNVKTKGNLLCH